MKTKSVKGQTLLEYILLVLMISVTVAVIIRNTNVKILEFWTGLASMIAKPCPTCEDPQPIPK
ncbi:hypothetical protein EBT16_06590 [bacterium]|nr:hypothetical protein [bacterium]